MDYRRMRIAIGVLFAAVAVTGCESSGTPSGDALQQQAEAFGEAWYNWRYNEAAKLVTPESMKWVEFMASNVSQDDLDALASEDANTDVAVDGIQQEDDTVAIVRYVVEDYMSPGHIGERPVLIDECEREVRFVKRSGQWLASLSGV